MPYLFVTGVWFHEGFLELVFGGVGVVGCASACVCACEGACVRCVCLCECVHVCVCGVVACVCLGVCVRGFACVG